jgi:hypothetical protein
VTWNDLDCAWLDSGQPDILDYREGSVCSSEYFYPTDNLVGTATYAGLESASSPYKYVYAVAEDIQTGKFGVSGFIRSRGRGYVNFAGEGTGNERCVRPPSRKPFINVTRNPREPSRERSTTTIQRSANPLTNETRRLRYDRDEFRCGGEVIDERFFIDGVEVGKTEYNGALSDSGWTVQSRYPTPR